MKYRNNLPQSNGRRFITDGGLETVMVFQEGIDLPEFSAITLLTRDDVREILQRYFQPYIKIATDHELGLVLGTPTWRASSDWAEKLGFSTEQMDAFNRRSVDEMQRLRVESETAASPMPISDCVGPRGDGYSPASQMTINEAMTYHDRQIAVFADSAVDFVSAMTLNYSDEAIGLIRAARSRHMPIEISFTVATDGRLPTGDRLPDVIERCDQETDGFAKGYMINCAHPSHFAHIIERDQTWLQRLSGIRANASKMGHAELNNSVELDDGDPVELAAEIRALAELATELNVFGGCCGTDHRHIGEIARAISA
jgi:homocysteine S-methyltransferase